MSYQIVFWSTIVWIAVCVAPYVYAAQRSDHVAVALAENQ